MGKNSDILIMAIDDEPAILNEIKMNIVDYDIQTYTDSSLALDELIKNHYDIIIIDHNMPKLSGTDVLSTVKKKYSDFVSILISSYVSRELAEVLTIKELVDYIMNKPIDFKVLKELIEKSAIRIRSARIEFARIESIFNMKIEN